MQRIQFFLATSALMTLSLCNGAFAQSVEKEVPEESDSTMRIEHIVVTAQRRGEDLQGVPISITAMTADSLEAAGVKSMQDMNLITPSLNFAESAGNVQPTLRGVGAVVGAGSESSVTMYVDGVYLAAASSSLFSLNNIERIEVLKGPQGTLFGRNSTGGVIQVITRDPAGTPEFEGKVSYGNYDTFDGSLYLANGLTENVAADLAVHYKAQGEGWGTNLWNGKDANRIEKDLSLRSKFVYDNDIGTKIVLAADYMEVEGDVFLAFRPVPGSLPAIGIPFPDNGGFYDINSEGGHARDQKNWGFSLKAEQDMGFADLVSITSYRSTKFHSEIDADGAAISGVRQFIYDNQEQMSQELQLLSPSENRIRWIGGLYLFRNQAELDPLHTFVGAPFTGLPADIRIENFARQAVSSIAAFGQVTVPVGEATNLTAGLRYTYDWREADNTSRTFLTFAPEFSDPTMVFPRRESEDGQFTWRLAIDHNVSNDVLVYGSYNRGFRSGVFPITQPTSEALEPEIVDAFELGVKLDAFDQRLRFNAAAFLSKSENLQLNSYENGTIAFFNAAEAEAYGVDIEVSAIPMSGLTLTATLGWVHSRYTDFPNAPSTIPNRDSVTGALTGGSAAVETDAKGNHTIRTPETTASFSVNYESELADGELNLTGTYYYNSGWYPEVDNRLEQDDYNLLSAQVAWVAPGGRYRVSLWGRNLGDKKYAAFLTEQTAIDGLGAAEPRTFGVTLDFKY